jgi:phosphonate transport system substrate-binding protein
MQDLRLLCQPTIAQKRGIELNCSLPKQKNSLSSLVLREGPAAAGVASLPHALRALSALVGLMVWGVAHAQSAVVEVKPGDTFSGIANSLAGSQVSWADVYDKRRTGLKNPNRIEVGMRFELVKVSANKQYLRLLKAGASTAAVVAPAPANPSAPATRAPSGATAPVEAAAPAAVQPAADTLVVGILPFIGATTLMAQYEGMKAYLERLGPQKVRIVLPANFKAFYDGLMTGAFDMAVAAPHFARVAQQDGRMVPLAMYEPRTNAQLVAPADSTLNFPRDLRGKVVAFANPTSLVAMYGQTWLRQQNLELGKDYEVRGARTDMGVGRMLLSGDAVAAVMSNGEFRALPAEEAARLKIVEVVARIPNFVLMGNPRLGNERLARLKAQLLALPADKEDGVTFSKATGISAIVEADEIQLRELDAYVAQTRRVMNPGN